MTDRTISASCVAACGLWALSVMVIGTGWIVGDAHLGQMGLAAAAAAATATVRGYFVTQNRIIRNGYELQQQDRERVSVLR